MDAPLGGGLRVVKLGGSLLSRANLATDLRDWSRRQPPVSANLYVIGGGPLLNAVRQLDAVHGFDPQAMHWRCVRMLRFSFELLGELIPEWAAIETPADFEARRAQRNFAGHTRVAVDSFFTPQCDGSLAPSWSTTTDSIAAFLASLIAADELVVLKSCDVDARQSLPDQVRAGLLDPQFPAAAADIAGLRIEQLPGT
ncbi:amino acid kinase family protein [Roseimaritima ulvae]|uniref:Amino acid kinase family protein n=1 Tax=Roseimaritima ulvae TaxID=980254 RepID=A0A5B9QTW5_9BACT|nr:hypothetical protein [Roseimaritima ulvae]QEG41200.1 Amino acid kinase family protein [Roseimaritima ulvae]